MRTATPDTFIAEILDPRESGCLMGATYRVTKRRACVPTEPPQVWVWVRRSGGGPVNLNLGWHHFELLEDRACDAGAEEYDEIMRIQDVKASGQI